MSLAPAALFEEPIRVLFVIRSLDRGGAEHQLVTLTKGLAASGHDVHVAVFYAGGAFEPALAEAGVPVHHLQKTGRWDVGFVQRLIGLVRRLRPQIVHPYLATSNKLVSICRPVLGGAKIVWGVRSAFMDLSRYDWLTRLSYNVEPRLSFLADAVIVNSVAARDHAVSQGFSPSHLVVVPNGIDCNRFRPSPSGRQRLRRQWDLGADELAVGVVGRLDAMKDHPNFLRAAAVVASDGTRVRFVCVGDGPERYRADLTALARSLGIEDRVVWAPATDAVWDVYCALDLLVLSSYGESFPNVVAEAMSCGVPCVVTDVGDARSIVSETGLVVPARDPSALAGAVRRALGWGVAERARRSEQARTRIVETFSIASLVENTVRVLDEVLHCRARAT